MSKNPKRKIVVNGIEYLWTMRGNCPYNEEACIRVHQGRNTKSILYIDPHPWAFEIRPKSIASAILFALDNGWEPHAANAERAVSMDKSEVFYLLKEGEKFWDRKL